MELWTEYEGLTVDGAYPLKKLLQPEGRSAFFATSNAKGESILIRLIECHFDEDEILARWRGVQALGHTNFLHLDRFGQLLIDDTTVVYAAFEHVDTDLATVLDNGSLSADDATQIGLSVASALKTLHANGFVHEHVEVRNVYAVDEAVKLRSDCIRETQEGEAGAEARRRDVQDLALLLKQVLLGTRRFRRVHLQTTLPAPFEDIVSNGTSGVWGLDEILAALAPTKAPEPAPAPKTEPVALATTPVAAAEKPFSFKKPTVPAEEPARPSVSVRETAKPPRARFLDRAAAAQRLPLRLPKWLQDRRFTARWLPAGVLLIAVLLFGWIAYTWFFRHSTPPAQSAAETSSTAQTSAPSAPEHYVPNSAPGKGAAYTPHVAASGTGATGGRTDWRVVAFTYNQESQARKKASWLAQRHPDLQPTVFSPSGGAPWLVTVGGVMQRDQAYAFARNAKKLGLPRDTYAQNYTAR